MTDLTTFLDSLSLDLQVCFAVAKIATILFVIKIAGLFIGGEGLGSQTDGNFADFDLDGDGEMTSAEAFNVFTIQSALAFSMVFGWSVLAGTLEYGLSKPMAYSVGTGLGVFSALLSSYLMYLTTKLNSPPAKKVVVPVGTEGEVYLKIPAKSQEGGQIKVVVNNQMVFVNAKTRGEEIPSFSKIKVVDNSPDVLVEWIK